MVLEPNSLSLIGVAAIIDYTLKLTVDNTEKKKKRKIKTTRLIGNFRIFGLGGQNNNLEVFLARIT